MPTTNPALAHLLLFRLVKQFWVDEPTDRRGRVDFLNPRQAGEVAKTCGVKKLVLTHYSGRDSDEAMLADCRLSGFEGEIVIAKDGDQYEIV